MATIRLSGVYFPGVELLSGIGTAIILYFGATRWCSTRSVTIGVMVAFVGYLSSFFDPIQQLSQLYNTFQSAMAALEKIFGVLDTEPELADAPGAVDAAAASRARSSCAASSFAYGRVPVLHGRRPAHRRRRDRRPGGHDRRRQVDAGQAHRALLRPASRARC